MKNKYMKAGLLLMSLSVFFAPTFIAAEERLDENSAVKAWFKDLLGAWETPCHEFDDGLYATQSWQFNSNKKFTIDAVISAESDCSIQLTKNRIDGVFKVGSPVENKDGYDVYEVDININGQIKKDIYTIIDDVLYFGEEAGSARPEEINFDRLNYRTSS